MHRSPVFTPPASNVMTAMAALEAQDSVVVTLPWRALAITGPDAQTFLQGQVTTDMREVTSAQSRLGCLLNLKGRVQISGRLLAWPEGYVLLLPGNQFDAARARLGKYGVFSKISLQELSWRIQGLLGQEALRFDADADSVTGNTLPMRIRLPGVARALLLTDAAVATEVIDSGKPDSIEANAALECWEAAAIAAGDWTLDASETELYQPQEMDYHALHGVSYQKGCYLGQEIVARLYFRGQLKTELSAWKTRTHCPAVNAGDALIDQDGQRVGEVIRVAWLPSGEAVVLAQRKRDSNVAALECQTGRIDLTFQPFTR